MLRFVLYLLTALDLALLVWGGGQIHPTIIPDLPPPPTLSPVMENNTIFVHIGENVTVRENVKVTMDCIKLVNILIEKGDNNSKIKWIKDGTDLTNGSAVNVIISGDERYCIITGTRLAVGGQLGNAGSYTCKVCDSLGDGTECENKTSYLVVCDKPHIQPPANQALIFPTSIILTCGADVAVDLLVNITLITIQCTIFNGTEPYTMSIYKDGNLTSYTAPIVINNPTDDVYGTYTFVVSNEDCGSDIAVSRLLQKGDPPDIDEGPHVDRPDTITEGNKRVTIGTPVYVFDKYNVTIDCTTVNGTPPITIRWLRNGMEIEGDVNTITIIDAKDGDVVICRARNNVGFDEEDTTINVTVCDLECKNSGTLDAENCSCQCVPGYDGSDCANDINECLPNPCQYGGTCTDQINNFTCECAPGYNGSDCGININDCHPNPCLNGGTCIDGINNYTCQCAQDFANENCFEYIGACPDNYRTVSVSFNQSSYSVGEGDGSVEFRLVLSSPLGCNCYAQVVVTTVDVTARRDVDYEPEDDYITVIFFNGMITSEPFYIKMTDNDNFEVDEIFLVTIDPLSLPYGTTLSSNASAVVTIKDDEKATVEYQQARHTVKESDGSVENVLVLSEALPIDVTITITTANGDTSVECDYDRGPYPVIIPAGETEWPFDAIIYDDDLFEDVEYFVLVIDEDSLPDRISRKHPYSSTVTIKNDEEPISVSFDDSSYTIKEYEGSVHISMSLDKPSPCCLHVFVELVNGTAHGQGVDYDYARGPLDITFPAGVNCSTFEIPIINDKLSESDETFDIIIMDESLPYGVIIGDHGKATVTILDNDVNVRFAKEKYAKYEHQGPITVELTLGDKIAHTDTIITVDVAKTIGARRNDTDYHFEERNITIQAGTNSTKFNVTILDDTALELDETFNLTITHIHSSLPYEIYGVRPQTTMITIIDNEYQVCFNETSHIVREADVTLVLGVILSRNFPWDINVTFQYNGLLANESEDYTIITRNDTIKADNPHYCLNITIIGDNNLENNELIRITIHPPVIPDKYVPCATDITIIDDDEYKINFEKVAYTDKKNLQTIPVLKLTYPANHKQLVQINVIRFPFNVMIDEVDVTARGGSEEIDGVDYFFVYKNYSVTFNDGEKSKSLPPIRTIDDNLVEGDEKFNLTVNSASLPSSNFITGENGTTTVTIENDDVCYLRLESGGMTFSKPLAANISMTITYFDNQRNTTVTANDTIAAGETTSKDPVSLVVQTHDIKGIEVFIPVQLYIPDDNRQNIKSSSERINFTKPT